MTIKIRKGLRVESAGDDLVVLDGTEGEVHSLSGATAEALRLVEAGVARSDIPNHLESALASLIDGGIVEDNGWSRRKMLVAGGLGATVFGGSFISMTLPAAADASSCSGIEPGDDLATPKVYNSVGTFSFTTGTKVTAVTVNVWGAGGGGGDDRGLSSIAGGGGGGGGFIQTTIDVDPCTAYTVTVGAGGTTTSGDGNDGGASTFSGTGITVTAGGGKGGKGNIFAGSPGGAGGPGGAAGSILVGSGSSTSSFAGGTGGKGADYNANGSSGGGGGGSAGQGSAGGVGGAGQTGGVFTAAPGGTGGSAGSGNPTGASGAVGGEGNGSGNAGSPGSPGGGGGGAGVYAGFGNDPSAGAPGKIEIIKA